MAEAFVWAVTDPDTGVSISLRAFGSVDDAKRDAQEAVGDATPIEWDHQAPVTTEELRGHYVDTNGCDQEVVIQLVKVSL